MSDDQAREDANFDAFMAHEFGLNARGERVVAPIPVSTA